VKVSCIILAGGRAKRIKKDKALLILNRKPLITYVLKVAKKFFSDIVVVVKSGRQKERLKKVLPKKVKIVKDNYKVYSPMAGIKEGAKHVKNKYVFVLACDMPFVKERTIRELLPRTEEKVDCIAYFWSLKRFEPLCAIYNKKVFKFRRLREGLHHLINRIKNKVLVPIPMETNEFFNINTEEDLKLARKLIKEKKLSHLR